MDDERVERGVERLAEIVLAMEFARTDGYARAYDVATARAESRRRLGLPIEPDQTDRSDLVRGGFKN
jgi:hypothetical protein